MKVIVRYQTATKALAGAQRLSSKFGRGRFAVVEDRSPAGGGDFAPFAVVSFAGLYA